MKFQSCESYLVWSYWKSCYDLLESWWMPQANENLPELDQLTIEKRENQHGRWSETSKKKYLNIKGLKKASGKNDESLKYFYKNFLSPPNHDMKVKCEVKDFISFDHTILSEKLLLENQGLAHFLFILWISMQLKIANKFWLYKLN